MKKKLLGLSTLTAALTLATGITAFAGSWQQDTNGWYYLHDDGSWQGCGWFTDPEDNSVYYLDPDGYMMSGTKVEGYKLGDDGRRIEKTEEDIQKEKERKQRIASKASPAKEQAAADLAADAAKAGITSVTTNRLSYQAEMKAFMDKYYINAKKALTENESENTASSVTQNNLEITYKYNTSAGAIAEASLWQMSNKKNAAYKSEAFIMSYNRNLLVDAEDINVFDTLFHDLTIAALGEAQGQAVIDRYNADIAAGTTSFDHAANTDSGNSYTMKYRNGQVTISVICADEFGTPANTGTTEETEAAAQTEETTSTSVIVVGQGETTAEENAEANSDTAETNAEAYTETAAEAE